MEVIKSIIVGVSVMTSLLLIMSCNDFIATPPQSELTTEQIFNSNEDFETSVNGVYQGLHDFYDYYWEFSSLRGDDVEQLALRADERVNMDQFSLDVNSDILHDAWLDLYNIIRSSNTVLSKLEEADPSIITGKDQYEGEVRFLRALAYFNLVRIFGDVPMVTNSLTAQEALEIPQASVDTIYDEVIINDLLEAEAKLPGTYSSEDIGKATKGAAKSLLGKVYLTRQNFDLAESKLMEVTSMGYSLLEDYEDLYNFDNEHHSEYIFDIEYIDGNIGLGSVYTERFSVEAQDAGGAFVDALREVFNYTGDVGGSGSGSPSEEFIDLFEPGDLRKDTTAVTGIHGPDSNFVEPAFQVKRITLKYAVPGNNFDNGSKANWRVIRYADVLLMLAEAMNENGKTNEALTYLNQVRTRAGLSEYSGLTQSEAREAIYLERRLELYLEGHRWFDLVRTGRALEVMEPYGMEPHMTVFPIPQSQIEVVNDPSILSQNPGY